MILLALGASLVAVTWFEDQDPGSCIRVKGSTLMRKTNEKLS